MRETASRAEAGRSLPLMMACLLLTWSPAARGGGFAVPELGARKTAMGAVVGRPDELAAIYHNPAGLVLLPGVQLYLNAGLSLPTTTMRLKPWAGSDRYITDPVDGEGYYPEQKPTRAFAVIPMIVGSASFLHDRLAVAAGIYVPNAVGAAFSEDGATRYHLVDSYLVAGYGTLAAAFQATPWLAVGAGVNVIYVRLKARRLFFPVIEGVDLGGLFGGKSELELSGQDVTAGFTLGLLVQPMAPLSLGLSVTSGSRPTLEGDVVLRLGEDAVGDGELSGTQQTEIVLPWTLRAGVNWDVSRWVEVGAEIRYYFYSQFDEQRTEIQGLGIIDELVTPKNYRDSWQVSGGAKVRVPPLPALELMAGMHFDRTPAPDETVSAEQPSFNHLGLHTGARYQVSERVRLALTYAHYFYLERSTDRSLTVPPSNFRASGQNHIITLVLEASLGQTRARAGAR